MLFVSYQRTETKICCHIKVKLGTLQLKTALHVQKSTNFDLLSKLDENFRRLNKRKLIYKLQQNFFSFLMTPAPNDHGCRLLPWCCC